MDEPLTHEHFAPHLHKNFRFEGASQVLRLDEIDVKDRPPLPHLPYKAFTLFFRGPRGDVLPEGFYVAEAEGGPRFEIYIIPVHTVARDRQDYQVVFN
jgi:hypothetical protein